MYLPGFHLIIDIHVKLNELIAWALFTNVLEHPFVTPNSVASYIRVITLDVEVSNTGKSEPMGIPGTHMEMVVAVLVLLAADACFLELIGSIGTYSGPKLFENYLGIQWTL